MKERKYIISFVLLIVLIFNFSSCGYSDKETQELKEALAPYDRSNPYIFITDNDHIYTESGFVHLDDITYKGEKCHLIRPDAYGMYAYSAEDNLDLTINIIYIEYHTWEITLVKSLLLPKKLHDISLIKGIFYIRMDDPETDEQKQIYFLYDMNNDQTSTVDTKDYYAYVEMADGYNEHFYNFERYTLSAITTGATIFSPNKYYITDNQTGMIKELDESLLDTCEEGKIIRSYDTFLSMNCAYEKDGYVYLLFGHTRGLFENDNYFIMKYDFETHTLEYYATIWEPFNDDVVPYLLIP